MAESKIEWTDATWNPTTGCTRASPGCDHCYAYTMTKRLAAMGQEKYQGLAGKTHFNGVLKTWDNELEKPLRWRKPCMVFVNSMSDLFHNDVPIDFIQKCFGVMAQCRHHTFQILTKRPERMAEVLPIIFGGPKYHEYWPQEWWHRHDATAFLTNVWLGTSVEDQQRTDRIDHLLECPAAIRFISAEPLIERTDFAFRNWVDAERRIDWVIVGGESGHGARPCHVRWIRLIVEDCQLAGVPCFVKQLGAQSVVDNPELAMIADCTGNQRPMPDRMPLIDAKGGDPSEWPEDLRVRQFPAAYQLVVAS